MSAVLQNLAEGIEQIVQEVVSKEMQKAQPLVVPNSDEVLTIPQMAKRLGIGKETAYNWIELPGFPVYDLGERQTRVIWGDVLAWVRRHMRKPIGHA